MISGLDHIVLVCPEIATGTAVYSALLGRPPDWHAVSEDGAATAIFRLNNTALELMAPHGEGPVAERLGEIITDEGPGLKSLAFGTPDIEHAHHRLTRRGLKPHEIVPGDSRSDVSGKARAWRRFRCADDETAGIRTFLIEHVSGALEPLDAPDSAVDSLDHIVINTPDPDRAAALYGARLGLDLALDRTAPEWKTRFLFFRTGGLTFEVINRLGEDHDEGADDTIWGLTWAVHALEAAHERLLDGGFDVSEMREGRKPGSRVFTVRNGTLNVPTLFISHDPK
jgi:catechol 2,3-dioxygenase-like lactoylglutathione lyase family enzyme